MYPKRNFHYTQLDALYPWKKVRNIKPGDILYGGWRPDTTIVEIRPGKHGGVFLIEDKRYDKTSDTEYNLDDDLRVKNAK